MNGLLSLVLGLQPRRAVQRASCTIPSAHHQLRQVPHGSAAAVVQATCQLLQPRFHLLHNLPGGRHPGGLRGARCCISGIVRSAQAVHYGGAQAPRLARCCLAWEVIGGHY